LLDRFDGLLTGLDGFVDFEPANGCLRLVGFYAAGATHHSSDRAVMRLVSRCARLRSDVFHKIWASGLSEVFGNRNDRNA
jgi:hypothetical protein